MSTTTLGPGAKARQLRLQKGISQEDLASKLGWTQGAVSSFESDRKPASLDRINKVALALGVDPHLIHQDLSPLSLRIRK